MKKTKTDKEHHMPACGTRLRSDAVSVIPKLDMARWRTAKSSTFPQTMSSDSRRGIANARVHEH